MMREGYPDDDKFIIRERRRGGRFFLYSRESHLKRAVKFCVYNIKETCRAHSCVANCAIVVLKVPLDKDNIKSLTFREREKKSSLIYRKARIITITRRLRYTFSTISSIQTALSRCACIQGSRY